MRVGLVAVGRVGGAAKSRLSVLCRAGRACVQSDCSVRVWSSYLIIWTTVVISMRNEKVGHSRGNQVLL
jgi:hypothetical protein